MIEFAIAKCKTQRFHARRIIRIYADADRASQLFPQSLVASLLYDGIAKQVQRAQKAMPF